ncbi:MAG: SUMF1/EgtB/PvdO family nonheme iron enzyme [Rhodoferax sp.]|nr:SUMF1/EgtB/PvdO family nonheme iron enzyme [Rhodoferax sp.]
MRVRVSMLLVIGVAATVLSARPVATLVQQNERLLVELQRIHGLSQAQMERVRAVFRRSGVIGQGNPAISDHPMSTERCGAIRAQAPVGEDITAFQRICGAPNMAPLYDPQKEGRTDANACIDQYEFPDIPCEYPVVWVRASEAAELCEAVGKRLCDAHEWEGACEGQLLEPDYHFELALGILPGQAIARLRDAHNRKHAGDKRWSYGATYQSGICGTASHKTSNCQGGGWNACGSNTYPAGAFPACRSALGVYDLNGNAAEHMNLPLDQSQMSSLGSQALGHTEMKGSWFVFDTFRAHDDWCRWRAPYWHGSRVRDARSHANYHLGFRCCKTVPTQ